MTELSDLIARRPQLKCCEESIAKAAESLCSCLKDGGKIVLAGNGGSAADCEHIVGELQKEFKFRHRRDEQFDEEFLRRYPQDEKLLKQLTPAVAAISLSSGVSINTALTNDVGAEVVFAQKTYALCRRGDIFWGISTSGNSASVIAAMKVAKALGCTVIALTGATGGTMRDLADILLNVPETETYLVQELHLPVYHYLCAEVERRLFG